MKASIILTSLFAAIAMATAIPEEFSQEELIARGACLDCGTVKNPVTCCIGGRRDALEKRTCYPICTNGGKSCGKKCT